MSVEIQIATLLKTYKLQNCQGEWSITEGWDQNKINENFQK